MPRQQPSYYDWNGKPVFGRTIKCLRCMGKGAYMPAGRTKRVECNTCKGTGYTNRDVEPLR